MRIIAFFLLMLGGHGVGSASLPVIERNGLALVTAAALEREVGIVIKRLPGRGGFIACGSEQCALLKDVLTEADNWLVPVDDLSKALNLGAKYDGARQRVTLMSTPKKSSANTGPSGVGAISPNLSFTKLDGSPVSLDEFRGQRVLVNSWASW